MQFTDDSTGGPTSWQWDFQNDGTVDSTQQNPSFVYPTPGTYSVHLTVSNGSGSDSTTRSGYVNVTAQAAPALSFAPTDDSFVRSNLPDENNGSLDNLRTYKERRANQLLPQVHRHSGVTGTVTSAKLRLYVVKDVSANQSNLFPVQDNSLERGTIAWATAPPNRVTPRIAQGGPPRLRWEPGSRSASAARSQETGRTASHWSGNLVPRSMLWFSSSEGANSPQLVLTQG